ncbi:MULTISPECIES: DUF1573 domain-containing protein [Flavobacteriaceae]|uniref:DUF1573 domain-containing protein n=2 Tax=Flavobacteriaceae TaxID=49546 RepID=A0A4Y8AWP9_9FLAO|nr:MULTISPECIES: DUF1573 domain-containing protein [Flavobacteriaceae]TEW76940.1 DUF1573 domain-containing protein [Gramella jeungdoensis]GGK59159.1 hypothetical protein GCM10007963_29140 [Lutibacter litoralis]
MRNFKILFVFMLSLAFFSCKENATSKINTSNLESAKERDTAISLGSAIVEFDKTEYDFGEVIEGEIAEGTFKITNKGKVDLIITSAKATCGCTVPEWPKEPIAPGASADLKFTFNSRGRLGKQSKSITLQTNSEKVTELIRIKGTVVKKS